MLPTVSKNGFSAFRTQADHELPRSSAAVAARIAGGPFDGDRERGPTIGDPPPKPPAPQNPEIPPYKPPYNPPMKAPRNPAERDVTKSPRGGREPAGSA